MATSATESPILVRYREEDPDKADRWQLLRPVRYQTARGVVTVPRGYVTDFASVPALLWGLFPPIGRSNRACLLHDWMYDNRLFEDEMGRDDARLFADRTLLDNLKKAQPTGWFRNYCFYLACRLFGRSWWIN